MNNKLKVGQVLWLKVRYQIDVISTVKHPMLIINISEDYIEVIALDKTAGKMHQLYHKYNYFIDSTNPKESVIKEDSYGQLNTKLTIEKFDDLIKYRKTSERLNDVKLMDIIRAYNDYQSNNIIDEQRVVHMTRNEIILLNEN